MFANNRFGNQIRPFKYSRYVQISEKISVPAPPIFNFSFGYSFRKINPTYTGFPCRLTRASDQARADIYFDESQVPPQITPNSLVSTGGTYTDWIAGDPDPGDITVNILYDQSGGGYDINSPDGIDNEPIFVIDGGSEVNNKPIMRSDGNRYIYGVCPFSTPGNFSHCEVFGNIIDTGGDNPLFAISNNAALPWIMDYIIHEPSIKMTIALRQSDNSSVLDAIDIGNSLLGTQFSQFFNIGTNSSTVNLKVFQFSESIFNSSSSVPWVNTSLDPSVFALFFRPGIGSFYFGDFAEFIFYNRALGDTERKIVTTDQENYYFPVNFMIDNNGNFMIDNNNRFMIEED